MTHELKTWPVHFENVMDLSKPFELRKNDRGFQSGDELLLREYDPETKTYTGRSVIMLVTCVLEEFEGLEKGYCIMGIQP